MTDRGQQYLPPQLGPGDFTVDGPGRVTVVAPHVRAKIFDELKFTKFVENQHAGEVSIGVAMGTEWVCPPTISCPAILVPSVSWAQQRVEDGNVVLFDSYGTFVITRDPEFVRTVARGTPGGPDPHVPPRRGSMTVLYGPGKIMAEAYGYAPEGGYIEDKLIRYGVVAIVGAALVFGALMMLRD